MRKPLLFLVLLCCLLLCFAACNNTTNNDPPETSPETSDSTEVVQPSETEALAPATSQLHQPAPVPTNTSEYSFFQVFEAPTGNPREIVMDYMMKMATLEWTPAEDFTIGWEGTPAFNPNMALKFTKGKTYTGTAYGCTHCTLELFTHFLNDKKEFKYDNYSYEHIIGNNCSTTMTLSYQQIIDLPISVLKPISTRKGLLKLAGDLKIPEGFGDSWYSNEVFSENGQEEIYKAYATLDASDILYKSIKGTGHTRMVRKVEPFKTAAGKIIPAKSFVYVVESTDSWYDSNQSSTWYIDKKYTFSQLYDGMFMPVTLEIFHVDNPEYADAYIAYKGTPSVDSIKKGSFSGVVSSNFPLNYVMATVTDENGNTVLRSISPGLTTNYTFDMRKIFLKTSNLPAGNYNVKVRVGIARGGADVIDLDFSIN